MKKPAISQVEIQETIANRWSSRAFDASKQVSRAQIVALLEAARWAPSSYGDQPWRVIVWNKNIDEKAWAEAFACLMPSNQAWVKDAPVLLLGCANKLLSHNAEQNRFAQYDTGAAIENLCLQATHMGLMTHQMGGFSSDAARAKFNIPAEVTPMAMLAVGYAGDASQLSDALKARDLAPRARKALGELFFDAGWGKPIA